MLGVARHRLIVTLLGVAITAAAVGSDAQTAIHPLTLAQYRASAKAICATATREQNRTERSGKTLVQVLTLNLQAASRAYDALGRLNPPNQLRQLHAAMLRDTRALLAEAPILIQAARHGQVAFARATAREQASNAQLAKEVSRLWVELGVPTCNAS